ncbi:recombinase family protein [Azospirillum melinis]|uniref:recombinase family protein n=2 Tax=Azospirillum melinis TaxID=328839 RepID=UPI003CCD592D
MAGEYSRELSVKVFTGQCRLIELGFRQGGAPGLGLRRMLVDQAGALKGELTRGQQKSIQTDRVLLTRGPDGEVDIVRRIYRAFVEKRQSERQIAEELNTEGILTDLDRLWTRGTVHQILINEKYVGNNVWNRTSFKLKKKRVRNEAEMWIRADNVFPAIVDRSLFDAAQNIIQMRSVRLTDAEMLGALTDLFSREETLSGLIIDEAEGLPSSSAYRARFGSLLRVYEIIGYRPRRDYRYIEINRALRQLYPGIVQSIIDGLESRGCVLRHDGDLIMVNGEFSLSVVISRCCRIQSGSLRWWLRFDTGLQPDITVAVRMNAANQVPMDFYLLPGIDIARMKLKLAEDNGLALDAYRFDTLEVLYDLAAPVHLMEAA